ncbi:MAG TPA: polysaccharide biosynthesis/export family protein [Arenimonas sp.]|uniref:polysaccharide biosynthesis/export family protein n=1 Tax=Arenimonas sp. TaxID=1872635 RepID=UPI002D1A6B18|nr:polysaccharide biosynthesis/export family protein [Arenimonas sp.]HMB56849.1 polysaccharide biosynthesis/export family protein [Arenimonas sp.]
MSTSRIVLVMALLALLVGCASDNSGAIRNGSARAVSGTTTLRAPDTTSSSGAYQGVSEYRVGPQDLIEISVFQVPDLNRTVRVNSVGQISLPLIGIVQAGGKTVQELETEVAKKLNSTYLQSPQVTVFVKEFTSQRVTLEGAVKKPGIYPLTGKTTLLQAVAMGEGLDPLADLKGVVIFRTIDGKKMAAVFDLAQIRAGNIEDPQVYGDDIVVIEQSGSKTTFRRIIESMPVLNLFRIF